MPHGQGPIPKLEPPCKQTFISPRKVRKKPDKYSTETSSGSGNISPRPRCQGASNNLSNVSLKNSPAEGDPYHTEQQRIVWSPGL